MLPYLTSLFQRLNSASELTSEKSILATNASRKIRHITMPKRKQSDIGRHTKVKKRKVNEREAAATNSRQETEEEIEARLNAELHLPDSNEQTQQTLQNNNAFHLTENNELTNQQHFPLTDNAFHLTETNQLTNQQQRLQNIRIRVSRTHNIARQPINDVSPQKHYIGIMANICQHCQSLSFHKENYNCCMRGKVPYEKPNDPPPAIKRLFEGDSTDSKHFQSHARQYNNAFAFSSIRVAQREFRNKGRPVYCISGQMVHFYGPLHPNVGQPPIFSQLYIFNAAESHRTRRQTFHGVLKESVMLDIITTLEDIENPYLNAYRTMYAVEHLSTAKKKFIPAKKIDFFITLLATHGFFSLYFNYN